MHGFLLRPPHADEGKRPLGQKPRSQKVYAVRQKIFVHEQDENLFEKVPEVCRELHE
jgi:hypothetical protein